ncbi:hypothetical protein J6590_062188 [Homalodisca vitripennis]|nr:hypothetical protein J6590_062188 [Homalodisca vitripennis]
MIMLTTLPEKYFSFLSSKFCFIEVDVKSEFFGLISKSFYLALKLNLGTIKLKVISKPQPIAGQASCLQGQDRSAVTHLSSSHARRSLILLAV